MSRKQHSADWSLYLQRWGSDWQVIHNGEVVEAFKTREEARIFVRQYKVDQGIAPKPVAQRLTDLESRVEVIDDYLQSIALRVDFIEEYFRRAALIFSPVIWGVQLLGRAWSRFRSLSR
jgi:hypothetical protein